MRRYTLLACDIDGTLLRSDGTASSRTLKALRLAETSGAMVIIATGRRIASTTPIARRLGIHSPCVAHCGAVVYDPSNESILMARQIPRQIALRACRLAGSVGADVAVHESVYSGRSIFVTTSKELEEAAEHWPFMTPYYRLVDGFEQACLADPVQLCLMADADIIPGLKRRLACDMPETLSIVDYGIVENGKHMLDIFAHGVDKAVGLTFVADLYGIGKPETVGFGDSVNDIELICHAGLGVAMGNAPDDIRRIADLVAPSNDDDGVAAVIEELAAAGLLGRGAVPSCIKHASSRLH
ncbi:MAG TPA: HAD family hydrolase [Bacillota bacterium]|nr:HAD family hydrolase [Bacillota bacterium]